MKDLNNFIQSVRIKSLNDLKKWTCDIGQYFGEKACILLNGPMGVGKTQFVKYLVDDLGGSGVCSPTFSIHNVYEIKQHKVHHVDLYRLGSEEDLEFTGFWDIFESDLALGKNYVLIEWAHHIEQIPLSKYIPKNWPLFSISMDIMNHTQRQIRFSQRE